MMVTTLPILWGALWIAACSQPHPTRRDDTAAASPDAEVHVTQKPIRLINEETLRTVVQGGGAVALVRVIKTEILHPGTRNETTSIDAKVLEHLFGTVGDTLIIRRYTRGGDVVLASGKVYAVALEAVPRFAPALLLQGFVAVAPDAVAATATAHREAIAKLTP